MLISMEETQLKVSFDTDNIDPIKVSLKARIIGPFNTPSLKAESSY